MKSPNDGRVDKYIDQQETFAQPILRHLRSMVHDGCPEVQENIKWGMPSFEYAESILCNMAAFKEHCTFGFWKGKLLKDPHGYITEMGESAMGSFGRITSLEDLPPDGHIIEYVREAALLNKENIKVPRKAEKVEVPELPKDLIAGLESAGIHKNFDSFPPSQQKEYVEWISEAKTETTRSKRLATTLEWVAEGKPRNWKYMKTWKGK